jgi:hypothetical protein
MKSIKGALGPAVVIFVATAPVLGLAQSNGAAPDIGARYGDPGYYGYHVLWRDERPPVPPADIPNIAPARNNLGSVRSNASTRRSPPLPRIRPADLASGVAKESAPRAQGEPKAAAPGRSDVVPAATLPVAPPTMVPVAPLE